MKKLLLASVVGLVASGAAQASVEVYGAISAGLEYVTNVQNSNGGTAIAGSGNRLNMNSWGYGQSHFGLRGSEDVGGGTKVAFVLENQFSSKTGAQEGSGLFYREANVSVSNDTYGKLGLGRQYSS